VLAIVLVLSGCLHPDQPAATAAGRRAPPGKPLPQLQRDFVDLRFGMFIHSGILTYTGSWAKPNLPIGMFNPTHLDPGQWPDAAVAAR
jgi:alpha-L-fucosidase